MDGMMDMVFFSASLTLSLLLLTASPTADAPAPDTMARRTLLTIIETRPDAFSYEFLGMPRTLRFKSYGQLLSELALLGFPPEFQDRLVGELEKLLDNLLPSRYRLTFRAGARSLEVGKGGSRLLCQEWIPLTVPSLPPLRAELKLELFA
jgi:hypothetical protein